MFKSVGFNLAYLLSLETELNLINSLRIVLSSVDVVDASQVLVNSKVLSSER